jgi:RNA polymerase sigma factor (TIGR02999 family)
LREFALESPSEITLLLEKIRAGDATARDDLFTSLVAELRDTAAGLMKQEAIDHSLQATALINEACVRLLKDEVVKDAANRRHLFGAANRAMRRVLIDHARARAAQKRGGAHQRVQLDALLDQIEARSGVSIEALDAAIERLGEQSARQREIVEHRFLAGLSVPETAALLDVSERTVEREWRLARAKLHQFLQDD